MSEGSESSSKEWVLEPETEYRFELDPGTSLAIKLLRGNAEIFGAEMVEGKPYLFGSECKAAVFTWVGCTLQMSYTFIDTETRHLIFASQST
ncbi:Cleavage polyadenylation factor subunit clp1 [Marasmius tenuissimus]|nr:Cleavage polyadenylation factor subunit clp1 [Marasmius tenuissimus]